MSNIQKIQKAKTQQRVRDIKSHGRKEKLCQAFCLAKSVNSKVFQAPLDLRDIKVPSTYED